MNAIHTYIHKYINTYTELTETVLILKCDTYIHTYIHTYSIIKLRSWWHIHTYIHTMQCNAIRVSQYLYISSYLSLLLQSSFASSPAWDVSSSWPLCRCTWRESGFSASRSRCCNCVRALVRAVLPLGQALQMVMYVCMYICIYVCMYVCMYVCTRFHK